MAMKLGYKIGRRRNSRCCKILWRQRRVTSTSIQQLKRKSKICSSHWYILIHGNFCWEVFRCWTSPVASPDRYLPPFLSCLLQYICEALTTHSDFTGLPVNQHCSLAPLHNPFSDRRVEWKLSTLNPWVARACDTHTFKSFYDHHFRKPAGERIENTHP